MRLAARRLRRGFFAGSGGFAGFRGGFFDGGFPGSFCSGFRSGFFGRGGLGGARLARAFGLGSALLNVDERFLHLVDEDEAQIARLQAVEGVVDGGEFAVDFFHVAGAFGALQALAQQGEDFAVGAAALAGVLVKDRSERHV